MPSLRTSRVVVLAALVVAAAAGILLLTRSEEKKTVLRRPVRAGPVARDCVSLNETTDPAWKQPVTTHRASWRMRLHDEQSDQVVGQVEVSWIYWVTADGDVHGMQVCWQADDVPADLAISADVHPFAMQPDGQPLQLTIDTFITVTGSAVVDESRGPQVQYPTATIRRLFETTADKLEVEKSSDFSRAFEPPIEGGHRTLTVQDQGVDTKAVESPYQ